MNNAPFRIGTRGSKLALAQANLVKDMLAENGINTEINIIKTSGDTFTDMPLHEVQGFGVFVREIDDSMLAGNIDVAVHSMKDVPTERPSELTIAAVMKRDSPYDFLLTRNNTDLKDLPQGAAIGTTSLRRRAQLMRFRSDLKIKELRGNIDTRLRKLKEGQYDGIFMAEAGLERMKWDLPGERLDPDDFVPSANQGTVVIVTRKDSEAEKAVKILDDERTRIETRIERIIIGILGGGCLVPIGAFAKTEDNQIHVRTEVLSVDGKRCVKIDEFINPVEYEKESERIGNELKKKGGGRLVDEAVKMLTAKRGIMSGKVYLVGSGPGDPELLTIKAKRLIESAEVILFDQLPGKAILDMLPKSAEKIDVGKYAGNHKLSQWQINELLVKRAKEGKLVVRLKGGDPYLFGRGGEEAHVLVKEGIEVEVVPGITSAIAVPAYAGIPVTHRDYASMVTFITGHEDPRKEETGLDWELLARFEGTLVILMGVSMLERNVKELVKHGKSVDTPVAVIERGTRPDQRVTVGTLADIVGICKKRKVKAPAITVIGDVVKLHRELGRD